MTRVAILWHMHQPYYEDLVTHEHLMPWVRLHALKDYYGMVRLVREFPSVRVTFNLVPSLLTQVEAFAAGRARDPYLDVGLKPAESLTDADKAFIIRNFFDAHRQHLIDPNPRYAELLALRGQVNSLEEAASAARRFELQDFRDLQVWQKLVWIDPFFVADPRIRALTAKDRGFTEDDKQTLRSVEFELLNAVIPAYRDAAASGQIELSTSPFYHPILPLLCDTDVYARTNPSVKGPRRRFAHPEDALEQLQRAVACHERLFGRRPAGLWPSEGSVSDAMVPLVARAGFRWMATDEQILERTIGAAFSRNGGVVEQPEHLYKPYLVATDGGQVACTFRDHALSDLIGFTYAGWPADRAAEDFVSKLTEAGRRYAERTGGEEATIPVILDGENAWEHYDGNGRPFLRALYSRLGTHPEIKTVTMAEACRETKAKLTTIFPGSWIDASFYIWIGHADDQRAWSELADARDTLESAVSSGLPGFEQAKEELLIAEGSDWCWWYGDDHSSDHDAEFDDLFRRHVRNVYQLLQKPVPDELFMSNISTAGGAAQREAAPVGRITPAIDGEDTNYFEWLSAGRLEVRDVSGAMHQIDGPARAVREIRFGFDEAHLYVRVDTHGQACDILARGDELAVTFLEPEGRKATVGHSANGAARWWTRPSPSASWIDQGPNGLRAAAASILELAVPLTTLAVAPGARLSFIVIRTDASGHEVERHPGARPIELVVPDASFDAQHWSA